jgi:hypothetical protein
VRKFYIREAPGLPTIKAQKIALGLDKIADEDPVYIDLNPKRKRATPAEPFPELALAIRALRPGDELGVAIPAILGGTQGLVLDVMQAIGAKQAAVYNAQKDEVVPWEPAALKVLEIAREADSFTRAASLRKARVRRAELGRGNGKVAALDKEKNPKAYKAALAVWLNPELTGNQAAAEIGVSPSTAYRKLGPRDQPIFGRKSKL